MLWEGVEFLFHINGDMSERVMSLIESMVRAAEIYSTNASQISRARRGA